MITRGDADKLLADWILPLQQWNSIAASEGMAITGHRRLADLLDLLGSIGNGAGVRRWRIKAR